MGFTTTASCYRSGGDPPIITGSDLATFCERLQAMNIVKQGSPWAVSVIFGSGIDQDDKPIYRERKMSAYISEILSPTWDVYENNLTPAQAINQLRTARPTGRKHSRTSRKGFWWQRKLTPEDAPHPIYRALLDFGWLRDEYAASLCHELENNFLYLCELGFHIGVIDIHNQDNMCRFEVGWMAFTVHGNGYPFPWSYEETLRRIHEHPQLQAVRDICRELWPASSEPVSQELIEARKEMGKFWTGPYDAPHDWYWVIQGCV